VKYLPKRVLPPEKLVELRERGRALAAARQASVEAPTPLEVALVVPTGGRVRRATRSAASFRPPGWRPRFRPPGA
jgi:hypothetical protein